MMVIRAQCTKPGLPNPDRVYALKVLFKIHESDTLTHVSIITAICTCTCTFHTFNLMHNYYH